MFSLTAREQTLIAAVLVAMAAGAVIHHFRSVDPTTAGAIQIVSARGK